MTKTITLPDSIAYKANKKDRVFNFADYPDESILEVLRYGIGRWAQDRMNSAANRDKATSGVELTEANKERLFLEFDKKLRSGDFGRAEAMSSDPVALEVVRLATAEILKAAGGITQKAAIDHPKAKKYFTMNTSGGVSPNAAAIREFAEKYDETLKLTERAKAIVNAKVSETEVEIDL